MTVASQSASIADKVYQGGGLSVSLFFPGVTGERILDVGCGTGNLGAALRRQGNECHGITVSEGEATVARRQLDGVVVRNLEEGGAPAFSGRVFQRGGVC